MDRAQLYKAEKQLVERAGELILLELLDYEGTPAPAAPDAWIPAVAERALRESASEAGKLQISDTTRQFLGDSAEVIDRGQIDLKNKGKIQTYFLDKLN